MKTTNNVSIDVTSIAIQKFYENIKLSSDMTDRKNAVIFLANVVGVDRANMVASAFGLTDQYYRVMQ